MCFGARLHCSNCTIVFHFSIHFAHSHFVSLYHFFLLCLCLLSLWSSLCLFFLSPSLYLSLSFFLRDPTIRITDKTKRPSLFSQLKRASPLSVARTSFVLSFHLPSFFLLLPVGFGNLRHAGNPDGIVTWGWHFIPKESLPPLPVCIH